jgi:dolichyl-diphosphooligosaccharide--protein glycosyltransferase
MAFINKELTATIFFVIVIAAFTTQIVPYLRDFDPWYHYRIAEYTLEQGTRPSFDPLSNMGENIVYPPLLHYLLAIPAHIPGLSLMLVAQLYPLIAGMLALIFLFLFTRELFGDRVAMFSALLLSLMPIFKATTYFGYSDHDALDYVFILSAFFFLVKAMKKKEHPEPAKEEQPPENLFKNKIYYALAGVSIGLFALTWLGFPMLVFTISTFILLSSLLNPYLKLLDKDMVIGFLILSLVFAGIASLWYGREVIPVFSVVLFSVFLSYVALRLENNKRAFPILIAIIVVCSLPLLIFFRSSIVDAGLTYIGLREKGVYLEYVAELKTTALYQVSQSCGMQLLPFLLGLGLFVTSQKEFRRETVFFLTCFAILILLASSAIRFLEYFSFFVSIFAAYFLNKLSEVISASVKRDVFIPLILVSALLLLPPVIIYSSVSSDWYNSLQWLRNNSNEGDVVMNWWDYAPWINAIAERKTVVNNQPPGRFDDSMIFFGTDDWERAKAILEKYNVSYVIVNRGILPKIYLAEKFLDEKIELQTAPPVREGPLYSARFSNKFKTYFDPTSGVAWDEYSAGRKVYYKEIGLFNEGLYKTQYFKAKLSGVEFNEDYLFIFSNSFMRIPSQTKKRVFFNLMYTESEIPYLKLVREEGEVRIYKRV